jgi:hypothetical protein
MQFCETKPRYVIIIGPTLSGAQSKTVVRQNATAKMIIYMKEHARLRSPVLISLVCAIIGLCSLASQRVPFPDRKDIIGTWFGFDENRLLFCRIELDPDGEGYCSTAYVDNQARLYSVRKWSLDGFQINIELQPVDKEAEPIYLKGLAGRPELMLEVGGVGAKWKRKLSLFNDQDVTSKNMLTEARIEKYKRARPH